MTRNALGPYQIRIKYAYAGRAHTMTFEVNGGGVMNVNEFMLGGSTSPAFQTNIQTAMDNFQGALRGCFSAATSFNGWELWNAIDGASPVFRLSGNFENPAGSNAQTNVPYGMAVFTFRTGLFGRFRLQLMESVLLLNEVHGYGDFTGGDPRKNLVDYVLGNYGVCKGRDGSHPTNFIRVSTKTSDALRRRYIMGF